MSARSALNLSAPINVTLSLSAKASDRCTIVAISLRSTHGERHMHHVVGVGSPV
jgi:hypothetical protein